MRSAVIALVLLAGPAASARAQTQLDADAAADQAFRKADAELNATYRSIKARLTPAQRAKLVKAQRLWVRFRDAECGFEVTSVDGGSAAPMVYSSCLEKLTLARTKALRAVSLDCEEGDLSCVFVGR